MDPLERLGQGLKLVGELLLDPELDPDPQRTDWDHLRAKVIKVADATQSEIVDAAHAGLDALDDAELRAEVTRQVAYLIAEVSVLMDASKARDGSKLFRAACALDQHDAELEAAHGDRDAFALLVRGRWLYRQGRFSQATKLFKQVDRQTSSDVLKQAARLGLKMPRPIKSAPPLFTLNGFGTSLYGERDVAEDGSYVTTLCLCALFIPVFPLSAYRVTKHGSGQYRFYAKQRLSAFARGYRLLLAAAVIVLVAWAGLASYYESPSYRASEALEQARQLKAEGKTDQAVARYEEILDEFSTHPDLEQVNAEAATALIDQYGARVSQPFTRSGLPQAEQAIELFKRVEQRVNAPAASEQMTKLVEGWLDELSEEDPADIEAGLTILSKSEELFRLSSGPASRDSYEARRRRLHLALGDRLAETWPCRALGQYMAIEGDQEAFARAGRVFLALKTHPFLLASESRLLERWLLATEAKNEMERVRLELMKALADARTKTESNDRQEVLAANEEKRLVRFLEQHPDDQDVAAAVASFRRQRGELGPAAKMLERFGPVGWLSISAQRTLAGIYADQGRLTDADRILDGYVADRLPMFQKAQREYDQAAERLGQELLSRADRGDVPSDLEQVFRTGDEAQAKQAFADWFKAEIAKNKRLAELKQKYETYGEVVPSVLTLGMIKLRLAADEADERRTELLGQAEHLFLAIRQEAQGLPGFHLGLGQVYHRLGKAEEGEAEFASVLAMKDPALSLGVASAYRELGQIRRAREVAEEVFKSTDEPLRTSAAVFLSVIADRMEDAKAWLKRADQSQPGIRSELQQIEGRRLIQEGHFSEADKLLAQVEAFYQKDARHSSASANNAAIASQLRYHCTGDLSHLERARQSLESSLRLEPDNALVLNNLAELLTYLSGLEVLGDFVDVAALRLDSIMAQSLLRALGSTDLVRDRLVKALLTNATQRRAGQITQQEEVLAPENTAAYARELSLYTLLHDEEKLGSLKERLERVKHLNTQEGEEAHNAFLTGHYDKELKQTYESYLRTFDMQEPVVSKKGDRPTLASLQLLRASAYMAMAVHAADMGRARKEVDQAVAQLRLAEKTWPELNTSYPLATSLALSAILELTERSPRIIELWQEKHRVLDLDMFLIQILRDKDAATILPLLRAHPSMREALALRKASFKKRPMQFDWAMARLFGDAEMTEASRAVFKRKDARLITEIEALLWPTRENTRLSSALYAEQSR